MSTPSKGNAAEDAANKDPVSEFFTVREQTIIMHSLLAMKELPTIDYAKVADRMGLQNPRSVGNAWSLIKKKIQTYDKDYRKRKGLPSEDEADDEDSEFTPKKTPKRARVTKSASGTPTKSGNKSDKAGTPKTPRGKKAGLLAGALANAVGGDNDEAVKKEDSEIKKEDPEVKKEESSKIKPEPVADEAI